MSKHTPGPWSVDLKKVGKNGRTPISASEWSHFAKVVVRMKGDEKNTPVGEANARLIAAAPDMLAALRKCLNYIENTEGELGVTLDSGDAVRAAIAKATGAA